MARSLKSAEGSNFLELAEFARKVFKFLLFWWCVFVFAVGRSASND